MKHHEESIKNMITCFQENPEIIALFLNGSVTKGGWTSYAYPKDFQFISNNFFDPYEL
jgi:hypothetical protein